MSLFTPKPPVDEDLRDWIEKSMLRLVDLFGIERLTKRPTILPNQQFFPDRYEATEESLDLVAKRVCEYMDVDFDSISLTLFSDQRDVAKEHLLGPTNNSTPAGVYAGGDEGKYRITIGTHVLTNPRGLLLDARRVLACMGAAAHSQRSRRLQARHEVPYKNRKDRASKRLKQ